jgi:citrate synthase
MRMLPPADGMDALRTIVSALAHYDPEAGDASPPAQYRKAVRLTAQAGTVVATWGRLQAGGGPVAPDPVLGHAANFLYMLKGERPDAASVRALDVALILHADHELNASTFAARVAAATLSDLYSAVVAAIGALKGPLHGGAPGPVLDMLDAIGRAERARAWLAAELTAGRRIMGLGHRVYRVRDPRALVLESVLAELEAAGVESRYLALARAVERAAVELLDAHRPERRLRTNVEFYTAVLLDALEIPRALFTPLFAAARVAGWLAHVAEERAVDRLIRPSQRYVGPLPALREAS